MRTREGVTAGQLGAVTRPGVRTGRGRKKRPVAFNVERESRRSDFAAALKKRGRAFLEVGKTAPIQSHFQVREVRLNAEAGTARVILIAAGPGNLADRHYYTSECLQASVAQGRFDGAQCFLDHPTPTEDREQPARSVQTLAGWFSDVEIGEFNDPKLGKVSAIFADFHPAVGNQKALELLRTSVEYAARYPKLSYVGFSINAMGSGQKAQIDGQTWNRVDEITEVVSVDIVTKAGARGKPIAFREAASMAARRRRARNSREADRTTTTQRTTAKTVPTLKKEAREALKKALEAAKTRKTARKIFESATGVDREAFIKAHATESVDGPTVAKMLDDLSDSGIEQLTGVHPDDLDDNGDESDDDEEDVDGEEEGGEMDATHGESEEDDDGMEDDDLDGHHTEEDGADGDEDDDEEPGEPFGKKGAAKLKAARKKEAAARRELRDTTRQLQEARRNLREANSALHNDLVKRAIEEQLDKLKVAENARPFLRRIGLKENSAKNARVAIREAYAAFGSRDDGFGSVARESTATRTSAPAWKRGG